MADPFTLIAFFESSYSPTAHNKYSTASGLFGDVNSTWAAALRATGGDPSQYPTAASAPPSVQFAANAYLLKTQGFGPWTCPGCDAALTAALAADGGPSAFDLASLSTNPADYAYLDATGALQAFFSQNGGTTVGGLPTYSTPGSSITGVTATQSLTTTPFQYAYSTMVDGVTQQIATAVQATTTLVHPYLVIALTLAAAFMGFRVMVGKQSYEGLASFAVRATIVGALLSPGSQGFMDWIEQPIMQLPSMIGAAFGIPDAGPAAIFDDAVHALSAINQTIQSNIPVSLRAIGNILFMDFLWLGGVIAFAAMFLPFLLTTFLLLLMLAIAPVPILFGLFPLLDGWAKGFADVIATLALLLLAIDVVVSIIEGGIINALNAFNPGGSSQADMAAFATMVLVFGAMAASIRYLGPLVSRISGGVSIAVESAAIGAARLASR